MRKNKTIAATNMQEEAKWDFGAYSHGQLVDATTVSYTHLMFRLVVNKKYASEQLLKEFDQKPTMLTPDDPLFQLED